MKIIFVTDLHTNRFEGRFAKIRSIFGAGNDKNLLAAKKIFEHIAENYCPSEYIICIGGDVTEHGARDSFVRLFLEAVAPVYAAGFDIHYVPGNHDVGRSGLLFQTKAFQASREFLEDVCGRRSWPYVAEYDNFDLVCIDTTCKSKHPANMAQGEVGTEQIALLTSRPTRKENVVLMHHSPLGGNPALWIRDREDFVAATNHTKFAVLFGHLHKREVFYPTKNHCLMIAGDKCVESLSFQVYDPEKKSSYPVFL